MQLRIQELFLNFSQNCKKRRAYVHVQSQDNATYLAYTK